MLREAHRMYPELGATGHAERIAKELAKRSAEHARRIRQLRVERSLTGAGPCTSMMSMKALPIGEARRRLPELIRRVAGGQGTVTIGRGGRPEVMLVPAGTPAQRVVRRPLKGLVEIVGSEEDLEHGQQQLRGAIEESLKRTAGLIARASKPRRSKPRRS